MSNTKIVLAIFQETNQLSTCLDLRDNTLFYFLINSKRFQLRVYQNSNLLHCWESMSYNYLYLKITFYWWIFNKLFNELSFALTTKFCWFLYGANCLLVFCNYLCFLIEDVL